MGSTLCTYHGPLLRITGKRKAGPWVRARKAREGTLFSSFNQELFDSPFNLAGQF